MARRLHVWQNGERVGEWERSAGGAHRFRYAASWLISPAARPLSASFPWPVTAEDWIEGAVVEHWFANLLPDSAAVRDQVARRFEVRATTFELLAEIGRDCVGAVQLLPPGEEPQQVRSIDAETLSEREVADELRNAALPGTGLGRAAAPFRISLAGAQEKTALLLHGGQWCRPRGSTPTTHILKLPMQQAGGVPMPHSLENEWLCGRLLAAWGMPVAQSRILEFEDRRCLAVERFDRRLAPDANWWMRLPQEDFCQALGVAPDHKYESDGGPGMAQCVELLRSGAVDSADATRFLRAQLLYWVLQATDGHAKNFSIQHRAGGGFRLTPFYDVLSAYPISGHGRDRIPLQRLDMAMAVSGKNRHYRWGEIRPRHWRTTAERLGLGAEVESLLEEIPASVETALAAACRDLPSGFPEYVLDSITDGARAAAASLSRGGDAESSPWGD